MCVNVPAVCLVCMVCDLSSPLLPPSLLPLLSSWLHVPAALPCAVCRAGRLVLGATRGDGEVGEDVTHNMLSEGAVQGLPVWLPQAADGGSRAVLAEFEVRGEVYIRSADFETVRVEPSCGVCVCVGGGVRGGWRAGWVGGWVDVSWCQRGCSRLSEAL